MESMTSNTQCSPIFLNFTEILLLPVQGGMVKSNQPLMNWDYFPTISNSGISGHYYGSQGKD